MSETLHRLVITIAASPVSGEGQKGRTEHVEENMTFPAALIAYTGIVDAVRDIIGKTVAAQEIGPATPADLQNALSDPKLAQSASS